MILPTSDKIFGQREQGKYIVNAYHKLFTQKISKTWAEIFQIDVLLDQLNIKRVVELGTGTGITTIYMGLAGRYKGFEIYTYDNKQLNGNTGKLFDMLNIHFEVLNIFENTKKIGNIISQEGLTLLYCDNGCKRKEITDFSKYMKSGDIMLIHDYGEEVKKEDIQVLVGFTLFEPDWFNSFVSMHTAIRKD